MSCESRLEVEYHGRPCNGLNIEFSPAPYRCINKRPEHWPDSVSAINWVGSGGSPFVFGVCDNCKGGKGDKED